LTPILICVFSILIYNSCKNASQVNFTEFFDKDEPKMKTNKMNNWEIIDGTVDIIGSDTNQDFLKIGKTYIDLDGGSKNGAKIRSKTKFNLVKSQDYTLNLRIAGQPLRNRGDNLVKISMGNQIDTTLSVKALSQLKEYNFEFKSVNNNSVQIIIEDLGNDNLGALLVEVSFKSLNI